MNDTPETPIPDTATVKNVAVALAPLAIGIAAKFIIWRAIGRSASKAVAENIPAS